RQRPPNDRILTRADACATESWFCVFRHFPVLALSFLTIRAREVHSAHKDATSSPRRRSRSRPYGFLRQHTKISSDPFWIERLTTEITESTEKMICLSDLRVLRV